MKLRQTSEVNVSINSLSIDFCENLLIIKSTNDISCEDARINVNPSTLCSAPYQKPSSHYRRVKTQHLWHTYTETEH